MEAGKPPAEVNSDVKAFVEFYTLYLMKGMTPAQISGTTRPMVNTDAPPLFINNCKP
jgi:hypothetical protein